MKENRPDFQFERRRVEISPEQVAEILREERFLRALGVAGDVVLAEQREAGFEIRVDESGKLRIPMVAKGTSDHMGGHGEFDNHNVVATIDGDDAPGFEQSHTDLLSLHFHVSDRADDFQALIPSEIDLATLLDQFFTPTIMAVGMITPQKDIFVLLVIKGEKPIVPYDLGGFEDATDDVNSIEGIIEKLEEIGFRSASLRFRWNARKGAHISDKKAIVQAITSLSQGRPFSAAISVPGDFPEE